MGFLTFMWIYLACWRRFSFTHPWGEAVINISLFIICPECCVGTRVHRRIVGKNACQRFPAKNYVHYSSAANRRDRLQFGAAKLWPTSLPPPPHATRECSETKRNAFKSLRGVTKISRTLCLAELHLLPSADIQLPWKPAFNFPSAGESTFSNNVFN